MAYCPANLSCYWELNHLGRKIKYLENVEKEIDLCEGIGQNVLAYATNREVKAKLERPKAVTSGLRADGRTRGRLLLPKLSHGGGSDDATNALTNLLNFVRYELDMGDSIRPDKLIVAPDDPSLYEYPMIFFHGRRQFRFTDAQRNSLKTYLERGGFLFGDSICASPQFSESIRRELLAMFPDASLERIPPDHPLFTHEYRGFDLKSVTLRTPHGGKAGEPLKARLTKTEPILEGLKIDNRLAVVFSPYDLSCALENHASLECEGYIKEDAARIGLNIILFALQQ